MIADGLSLTVIGMAVVFIFLAVIVIIMNLLAVVVRKFFPIKEDSSEIFIATQEQEAMHQTGMEKELAAAAAAAFKNLHRG